MSIENVAEAIYWLRWHDPQRSINEYSMYLSALSLFTVGDNGQYWTPATVNILQNYRKVKKAISKRKPIYATIIEFDNNDYTKDEYIKIRIA